MSKIHKFNVSVYYEDTDAGGIVYYANYLKFIERARTEMIYDHLKLSHTDLRNSYNLVFVVKSCNIKYLKPAKFEDKLVVCTRILKKTEVRLNILQEIMKGSELLISSEVELAVVNPEGKIKKLPNELFVKL
jgi:acyl-CoA thioester hydrolase